MSESEQTEQLENHPIAGIFPMLEPEPLSELADSIKQNGQRHEIILLDGKILDGRNRYGACALAGVAPKMRDYDPEQDGSSVLEFVLDENLKRRHLSASQRAMIAAQSLRMMQQRAEQKIENEKETTTPNPDPETETETETETTEQDGTILETDDDENTDGIIQMPTQGAMAETAGVSKRHIQTAEKVLKDDEAAGTDNAGDITKGEKTLSQVEKEKRDEIDLKEKREKRGKILAVIKKNCGKEFAQAITDNSVLKSAAELRAFVALDAEQQGKVAPLIVQGWKVTRALAHILNEITESSTVQDLINRSISEKGFVSVKINGYEVTVEKINE